MWDVYISAWRAEETLGRNLFFTAQLMAAVPGLDAIDSALVFARYKGAYAQSIRVSNIEGYEYYRGLAQDYQQESILTVRRVTSEAWLRFTNPTVPDVYLGKLREAKPKELEGKDFSYDGNRYYVIQAEDGTWM